MEFRRITALPPYALGIIDGLKKQARWAGEDVVDLAFGNPDIPSPALAVDKLAEAARNPRNHRYSLSRGLPKLREALADLYLRQFEVTLDPETEVINTIGAKEGFSHLMWTLLQPGDAALVPSPSYPIHIYGPLFAGADVREMPLGDSEADFFEILVERYEYSWPKPRVIVLSFPTTRPPPVSTSTSCRRWSTSPGSARWWWCTTSPTPIWVSTGTAPSILQAEGAKEVAVELYSMTKSFSMAGWRVAFMAGNPEMVAALAKLKSYLDYGTFQPIQIAATVTMNEASEYPSQVRDIYQARRDCLCDGLARIGWPVERPQATMFVWAPIPEAYQEKGSVEFASDLVTGANVATSPGVGFGPGGDGHVRFALIENEQRITQAVRNLRRALTKL